MNGGKNKWILHKYFIKLTFSIIFKGCAGIVVGQPFDCVKVHLQTQDYKNPKYNGTYDCIKKIIKSESITGLYRGMSSPMAGIAFVNAIVFGEMI